MLKRLVAVTGHAGDGWAAPVTYASLQVLEQAIEKAGSLDRKKVLAAIENGGPYQTIVGPIDLKTHIRGKQFGVGQWQDGAVRRRRPRRFGRRQAVDLPQAGVVSGSVILDIGSRRIALQWSRLTGSEHLRRPIGPA